MMHINQHMTHLSAALSSEPLSWDHKLQVFGTGLLIQQCYSRYKLCHRCHVSITPMR